MRTIYVAGYPKSGTTWLTRLLGDAFDCPTGAGFPPDDVREPATEGQGRSGPFVVRKGHFELVDEPGGVVPTSHRLNYRRITDEGVVFITRDTRDVVCSVRYYWDMPTIEATINNMAAGHIVCNYNAYMEPWLARPFEFVATDYDALWADTQAETARILAALGETVEPERITAAVARQSFAARKTHAQEHGQELVMGKDYHVRFYRRGTPGAWKDEFTVYDLALCQQRFGGVMRALGHIESETL
jgi:hypothetical protein